MLIRPMERHELSVLVEWAAGEGWNPGLGDVDLFWVTDPSAFVAAEVDGQFVGGGSIVAYGRAYGFMGLFIVRPDLRNHGLGRELWHARKELLLSRLDPGAAIEMDGVFEMQPFYASGGFVFQHRDLRFKGVAPAAGPAPTSGSEEVEGVPIIDLADIPFRAVEAYDRAHFPAPRPEFLRRWIDQPDGHALGAFDGTSCHGIAVSRRCRVGYKVGPLFADDPTIAENLFVSLTSRVAGEPIFLDVPESNPDALDLVRRHRMREVFGCARMTLGSPPPMPWHQIFGVTTFELG